MQIIARLIDWLDTAPATQRVRAVDALVRAWDQSPLDDEARDAAEAAMTCILDDEEEVVREALAHSLSKVESAPRHLLIALAGDTPAVSLPVLRNAAGLLNGELVRIAENGEPQQRFALACRERIGEALSSALIKSGEQDVCLALLMNPTAQIDEVSFFELASTLGDDATIRRCMLARPDIGMRARTRLIEAYAESLYDEAERKQPRKRIEITRIWEKSVITYAAQIEEHEVAELIEALIDRDRLTSAFLLRAICMGNLTLFCYALSRLSGQPLARVERVLKDQRKNAFHAVYEKAELPKLAEPVFFKALQAWCFHLSNSDDTDTTRLQFRVAKEVLASIEGNDAAIEDLLVLLRSIVTDSAREEARGQIARISLENAKTAALAAPDHAVTEDVVPLDEETVMAFAIHFADELAELALSDEQEIERASDALLPANDHTADDEIDVQAQDLALHAVETVHEQQHDVSPVIAVQRSLLNISPKAA